MNTTRTETAKHTSHRHAHKEGRKVEKRNTAIELNSQDKSIRYYRDTADHRKNRRIQFRNKPASKKGDQDSAHQAAERRRNRHLGQDSNKSFECTRQTTITTENQEDAAPLEERRITENQEDAAPLEERRITEDQEDTTPLNARRIHGKGGETHYGSTPRRNNNGAT